MATAPVVVQPVTIIPAPVKKPNGFVSFLDAAGRDFQKGVNLVLGDVSRIAAAEAPVLTTINPAWGALATQIGSLSTQALAIVVQTEQKFAAMGQQTGSGLAKFAEAASILAPAAAQILGLAGVSLSTATASLVNGAVGVLNALPAALATSSTTPVPTPPAA